MVKWFDKIVINRIWLKLSVYAIRRCVSTISDILSIFVQKSFYVFFLFYLFYCIRVAGDARENKNKIFHVDGSENIYQ